MMTIPIERLGEHLASDPMALDHMGVPGRPITVVDLGTPGGEALSSAMIAGIARTLHDSPALVLGITSKAVGPRWWPLQEALVCTLVPAASTQMEVAVADLNAACAAIVLAAEQAPGAAVALNGVLRATDGLPVAQGLAVESLAYSMLLAGPEFARWRPSHPVKPLGEPLEPVLVSREGSTLSITINTPERRNAFSRHVRDGLVEALDLADRDPTIEHIALSGTGPSFSSGGDLDEFGSSSDVTIAHIIRLERSVAMRMHGLRDRVKVRIHGECIGAGIEIPSFAGSVIAHSDTFVRLPELAMGLIPGAGGTVGITKRIGRWRTGYLALSGVRLDAATALSWGLIDAVAD